MSKAFPHYLITFIIFFSAIFTTQSAFAEEGIAAYYSDVFHGRKTASGDIYNKNKLTAAHKTLPYGTKVKVTHLKNDKSVIVTITDRGPFTPKRIIDLSYAAAQTIDLIKPGISMVRLEILD
ncbi:MAG: septal ring lytic transglycosylase RlpA family protein [Methylococcales bacterium]|nr:septal ring lytic transglycosylase RlpA family protein [Methylococcales bacterium]